MALGSRARLLSALVGGLLISVAGGLATLATGSLTVAWLFVPGLAFVVNNMRMNGWAGLWFYGGIISNIVLWAGVVWLALQLVIPRRSRGGRSAA